MRSGPCWRGCGQRGTILHLWQAFPILRPFWVEVRNLIIRVTQHQIADNALSMLFHDTYLSVGTYKHSLMPRLLNAGKCLIPSHWKYLVVPTIREWLLKVQDITDAEEWRHQFTDNYTKF